MLRTKAAKMVIEQSPADNGEGGSNSGVTCGEKTPLHNI
jgi:hypothetical protein